MSEIDRLRDELRSQASKPEAAIPPQSPRAQELNQASKINTELHPELAASKLETAEEASSQVERGYETSQIAEQESGGDAASQRVQNSALLGNNDAALYAAQNPSLFIGSAITACLR